MKPLTKELIDHLRDNEDIECIYLTPDQARQLGKENGTVVLENVKGFIGSFCGVTIYVEDD